ncbi:hypothetical protein CSAL01_11067 [Colletotrichum salicis]|uniref:Uncharacterized protein n=1 Tax=Colletotrichum salicis TaxID=1209931 RepID=A0A135URS5_9PEZI|nr:hypothetical protein CSAL01_11067 [Colletotrichum salicis]
MERIPMGALSCLELEAAGRVGQTSTSSRPRLCPGQACGQSRVQAGPPKVAESNRLPSPSPPWTFATPPYYQMLTANHKHLCLYLRRDGSVCIYPIPPSYAGRATRGEDNHEPSGWTTAPGENISRTGRPAREPSPLTRRGSDECLNILSHGPPELFARVVPGVYLATLAPAAAGSRGPSDTGPSFAASTHIPTLRFSPRQLRTTMERYDYGTVSCITSVAFEQPTVSSEALIAELKRMHRGATAKAGHVSSRQSGGSDGRTAADIRWRVRVRRELWDDACEFDVIALLIRMTSHVPYIPYGRILFAADCPTIIHPESTVAREIRYHLQCVLTQVILDRWSVLHPQHGLMSEGPGAPPLVIHRGASPALGPHTRNESGEATLVGSTTGASESPTAYNGSGGSR